MDVCQYVKIVDWDIRHQHGCKNENEATISKYGLTKKNDVPWKGWRLSVSGYGNFVLCHGPQDQNIHPCQSVQVDPHCVQPKGTE